MDITIIKKTKAELQHEALWQLEFTASEYYRAFWNSRKPAAQSCFGLEQYYEGAATGYGMALAGIGKSLGLASSIYDKPVKEVA